MAHPFYFNLYIDGMSRKEGGSYSPTSSDSLRL